ncbi:MAG TPA: outer membrane protein assembly factor BamB [Burkholderiaceae bacterium]|nr:outer membrane protein assembly factor BamB [Burkholderiaceae bacterium]
MSFLRACARATAWIAIAAGLAACSGPDKPKPTPLEQPAPSAVQLQRVWTQRLDRFAYPLSMHVVDGQVQVADNQGQVLAIELTTGRVAWQTGAGAAVAAGVGSDGRWTAVVTRNNELVVFAQGRELWRRRLPSATVTAPLVAGERVFVYASDRSVHAFDAANGGRLWSLQRPGDPLTLAHPGVLMPVGDTLVVGQGSRLAGLDPLRGTLRWEVTIASPRGVNEVERLADLVGPAARDGRVVCVRAYQLAVGCVDAAAGTLLWSRNTGGSTGLALDAQRIYGVDASDRITVRGRASGEVVWTSERFRFRNLTAPAVAGDLLVVGDEQGYVHVLARRDGQPLARLELGAPVVGAPVVAGSTLLLATRDGTVHAYRLP